MKYSYFQTSYPMGSGGSLPGGKSGWGLKLTTHLHRATRLYLHPTIRLRGVILS